MWSNEMQAILILEVELLDVYHEKIFTFTLKKTDFFVNWGNYYGLMFSEDFHPV